ncbi:unnamed protein product [Gongylonema pulchrum]|uniref:mRNA_cap_C domain-containing protein n=1 Tax=Gongylonema pulchrum TaxID=637853 RepID=A0A183EXT4_9BILA|nr:unnamed protein product [Gongylonema pulchrum]
MDTCCCFGKGVRVFTIKGSGLSIAKNNVLLLRLRGANYFACLPNRLSLPVVSALRIPDSTPYLAVDRAVTFAQKDRLPLRWIEASGRKQHYAHRYHLWEINGRLALSCEESNLMGLEALDEELASKKSDDFALEQRYREIKAKNS